MTYKHRDIVIAYMDGKTIQVKVSKVGWQDLSKIGSSITYLFGDSWEYRIKPETKKYRVVLFKNGKTTTADSFDEVLDLEEDEEFSKWLTDWVEYEV